MDDNTFYLKWWQCFFIFVATLVITFVLAYHVKSLKALQLGYEEGYPMRSSDQACWVKVK